MQVFASMKEVLVTAPMIAKTSGHSHTELQRRWANWRKEVRARLDSGEYLPFQELQLLAKVGGRGWGRGWGSKTGLMNHDYLNR